MTELEERWDLVGEAIRGRMRDLGMTQLALIKRAGVSEQSVRPIMQGKAARYRPTTLAKVSRALGWTADSIERIVSGDEPVNVAKALEDAEQRLRQAENVGPTEAAKARTEVERLRQDLASTSTLPAASSGSASFSVSDLAEVLAVAVRSNIAKRLERLSYEQLVETLISTAWAEVRQEYEPNRFDLAAEGLEATWRQSFAPSLDAMLWRPPGLHEINEAVEKVWKRAQSRWETALNEHGAQWRDQLRDPHAEFGDYAYAAHSGEDTPPTGKGSPVRPPFEAPIEPEGP